MRADTPEGRACMNCNERPATIQWVGEGGMLAMTRGWFKWWCERCCVAADLDYARRQAARVPGLEAELAALP